MLSSLCLEELIKCLFIWLLNTIKKGVNVLSEFISELLLTDLPLGVITVIKLTDVLCTHDKVGYKIVEHLVGILFSCQLLKKVDILTLLKSAFGCLYFPIEFEEVILWTGEV